MSKITDWLEETFKLTYTGHYSGGGYRMEHPLLAVFILFVATIILIKLLGG